MGSPIEDRLPGLPVSRSLSTNSCVHTFLCPPCEVNGFRFMPKAACRRCSVRAYIMLTLSFPLVRGVSNATNLGQSVRAAKNATSSVTMSSILQAQARMLHQTPRMKPALRHSQVPVRGAGATMIAPTTSSAANSNQLVGVPLNTAMPTLASCHRHPSHGECLNMDSRPPMPHHQAAPQLATLNSLKRQRYCHPPRKF